MLRENVVRELEFRTSCVFWRKLEGSWQSSSLKGCESEAASGQIVRPSGNRLAVSFAPFIDGMFVDARLRRSWCGGRIIFAPRDFPEEFFEADPRLLRMLWYEEGSFCCQGEDGIFELTTLVFVEARFGGQHHHCSSDDGHGHRRKQFLANPIGSVTMEGFDLSGDFFISVRVFHLPAFEIQSNDVLTRIDSAIQQVGNQHRDAAIGMLQEHNPQADRFESFALSC